MKKTAFPNQQKGGKATLHKYGPEHFSAMAKKMWEKQKSNNNMTDEKKMDEEKKA